VAAPRRARTAIVVEGGAMRGIFSVGVLDVLLERGFEPFDLAIGVSAGACNLASHVARQEGRNRRCYFDLMARREFIDLRRALRGGSIVDLDWLWERLAATEPLDAAAIAARAVHPEKRVELVVVATSLASGDPVYLRPGADVLSDALKASCALPGLYRRDVAVAGEALVDGGVSDPIPAEEAYRLGARRILVVRSRPAAFVKTNGWSARLTPLIWRSRPVLARAMLRTAERYQRAVAFLQRPPADCRIVEVAPASPLATGRMTQDRAALEQDYALGRRMAEEAIAQWGGVSIEEGPRPRP
jgi:predicted patatin/cPLA2 family phospholipase